MKTTHCISVIISFLLFAQTVSAWTTEEELGSAALTAVASNTLTSSAFRDELISFIESNRNTKAEASGIILSSLVGVAMCEEYVEPRYFDESRVAISNLMGSTVISPSDWQYWYARIAWIRFWDFIPMPEEAFVYSTNVLSQIENSDFISVSNDMSCAFNQFYFGTNATAQQIVRTSAAITAAASGHVDLANQLKVNLPPLFADMIKKLIADLTNHD